MTLSHTIITKLNLCHLLLDNLEKLEEMTGETAHISVIKEHQALYLLKIDSSYPAQLLSHAGRENPIYCTSTGQKLLAYQDAIIEQVISESLTSYTSKTITNLIKLKNLLKTIRSYGYAVSEEELHEWVVSIVVLVKNNIGNVIVTVSFAEPTLVQLVE